MLSLYEGERRRCNIEKILKLALLHDLEEAIMGDLTPEDKRRLGKARVRRERDRAIKTLLQSFPAESQKSYLRLWTDLQLSRSREAKIVHQLDKIEMALQARDYANQVGTKKVADFYRSAAKVTVDASLRRELESAIGRLD